MTEWGTITVYNPSLAAKAADMFNAFNEIWPGGFRGGMLFDEQRVKDWLDKTSAIVDLFALDSAGNPVGYCGLYPHFRDAHAAYISILGVHPLVLGKKYGKRLLLKALEIAAEKGIQRVDLRTWSGNLKAVPLYKKVGFFWVPNTSCYMQDYIPGLFQNPLAKEWFAHHPDWYSCFNRELKQAPDTHVRDGMEVYMYQFEAGTDTLSVTVDRYGWGFSGIERVLAGKKLVISTTLYSHEILLGMPNALTISITNETGDDIPVVLQVEPFTGLQFSEPFPSSVTVKNGEKIEINREFIVDSNATVFKSNEIASEAIKSVITVGGQPVELYTGGKIRPAVTLHAPTPYKIAPPGKETTVYLDVINNTQKELTGKIHAHLEGVPSNLNPIDFVLSPQKVSGVKIPVVVPCDSPCTVVHATPVIVGDDSSFTMPSYQYSVVADVKDVTVVVEQPDKKEFTILTDFVKVSIECEGGRIRAGPRSPLGGERIDFEIGPPFGLSLDKTLQFDFKTIKEGNYTTAVLTGDSIHVPGARIKKYVKIAPGMHEVEFWATVTNVTTDKLLHVAGKATTGREEGLTIDLFDAVRRVFTPVNGVIMESDPSTNFMGGSVVPQDPKSWQESWTAAQQLNSADFSGWIWNPDTVEKITVSAGSLHALESTTTVLTPGETWEPVHVWYTFSHGSVAAVRNRWNQLVGSKEIPGRKQYTLETTLPITVECDDPFIKRGKTSQKTITFQFATAYPFPGVVTLHLPAGWKGHFVTDKGACETVGIPDALTFSLEIELSVPSDAPATGLVQLHVSGEYELDFDVPFLVIGEPDVIIETNTIDGQGVMEVSNGVIAFTVVTGVGGSLIRLQDEKEQSFFADNYPEIKPKGFISYSIGGIQPFIFEPSGDDPFVEPEKTHAEPVKDGVWKGVKVSWTVENQEFLRGQKYSLTYYTLPESPVVRIRLEHENPTPRFVQWAVILLADVALQGDYDGTVLKTGGINPLIRNRAKNLFMSLPSLDNPWVTAVKNNQSLTFFVPDGYSGTAMMVDVGEVIHGLLIAITETEPEGKNAVEFAFAVNQCGETVQELRKVLAV